jgi:hypothetical protein
MTYKMTDEYQKILTAIIGEKWIEKEEILYSFIIDGILYDKQYYPMVNKNRSFTTPDDKDKVFKWLVVNGKWEKFYYWAFEYAAKDETYSAWLFYDAERFCCLAAMAKKEGVT